jgi:glycosyltransferase involved in cell wall biosynthesis
MDFLVDVNIAVFNHAPYLEKTLNSILSQKANFPFRLLIGDDCSTDGSIEILKEFEKKNPDKIKVIYQEKNLGLNATERNGVILLKNSQAKYIALVDGDDYWTDENKLQKQIDFLESNPDFSISFHKIIIEKDGEMVEDYITKVPSEISGQEDLLNSNFIHTVSVVFRNNQIKLPSWFTKAMPGDYPLWLLLTSNGKKIKYFDEVMGVYRVHTTGIWSMQDGSNKYAQQIAVTFMNCAREIDTYHGQFLDWIITSMSDSVREEGYVHLTRAEYLSNMKWALKRTKLTRMQKLEILNPKLKKINERTFSGLRKLKNFLKLRSIKNL